jgi:hypothetical protein
LHGALSRVLELIVLAWNPRTSGALELIVLAWSPGTSGASEINVLSLDHKSLRRINIPSSSPSPLSVFNDRLFPYGEIFFSKGRSRADK